MSEKGGLVDLPWICAGNFPGAERCVYQSAARASDADTEKVIRSCSSQGKAPD